MLYAAAALTLISAPPPNVVLMIIDDMGWRDVAVNGSRYYKTPNIDQLAREGIRFVNGYAPAAVCSPTRAALLTGKSPARLRITDWIKGENTPKNARHQLPNWVQSLPKNEITLAELLKSRGYATGNFGKWHLGGDDADRNGPLAHGFDVNRGGGHLGQPASYFWPYGKAGNNFRVPGMEEGGRESEYLTDRLTDEAIRFIDQNRDRPFFVYLPHYAVHGPLGAKQADIEAFGNVPPDGKQDSPLYAAMVKAVDDSVGKINAYLKGAGLDKNTIFVFTSDNGGVTHYPGHTHNAPLRAQKGFPYEGGVRVPLIVKAPGIAKPNTQTGVPVTLTDFFPMIGRLVGARIPDNLDGADILPVLKGGRIRRDTFVWHYPHYWNAGLISPWSAIRVGDWKLVRWYDYDSEELYNLKVDPYEKSDLAISEPRKRFELAMRLDAELAKQGAQMPVPNNPPRPAKSPLSNPALAMRFR